MAVPNACCGDSIAVNGRKRQITEKNRKRAVIAMGWGIIRTGRMRIMSKRVIKMAELIPGFDGRHGKRILPAKNSRRKTRKRLRYIRGG